MERQERAGRAESGGQPTVSTRQCVLIIALAAQKCFGNDSFCLSELGVMVFGKIQSLAAGLTEDRPAA